MTDDERRSYERPDDLHKIFPLQPTPRQPVFVLGTSSFTQKLEKGDKEKGKNKNVQAKSKAVNTKTTSELY